MHGVGEVVELIASWSVSTSLIFGIILLDELLMSEARLERAWPPASRNAAIIAFGPIALLVHFARTLGHFRSLRGVLGIPIGLLVGIAAAVGVAFVNALALSALAALGMPLGE